MEKVSDKEKLALLGFDDPVHSLAWYKARFSNMPEILEKYIVDTLNTHRVFPKEAGGLEDLTRYHKFYLIIDVEDGRYIVKVNNTDRREIEQEYMFTDAKSAARFLISRSYSAGGSIRAYWKLV